MPNGCGASTRFGLAARVRYDVGMSWRIVTDFIKHRDWPLRVTDRLGRGRGRLRVDDWYSKPPTAPVTPDLTHWETYDLAAAWIGHATVLIRIGGKTILTDPVFSTRVGIGFGLFTGGPRRFYRPAISIRDLPPLDAIVISHAHFDHLDRPTLARLSKRVPVIASTHLRDLIADLGYRSITELAWGQSHRIGGLKLTAVPVHHWGARTFLDKHRGFGGFVIESGARRILYGGDSAYHDDWKALAPVDLAIVGIGAYDPYIVAHASPEQAWEMARIHVQAEWVLPMHHSTFRLSHEPMREPIRRMLEAAGEQRRRVVACEVGDMFVAPVR